MTDGLGTLQQMAALLARIDTRLARLEALVAEPAVEPMLTVTQKARQLGTSEGYVREHAVELGAVELPTKPGTRRVLRFPTTTPVAPSQPPAPPVVRHARKPAERRDLLPIRGHAA